VGLLIALVGLASTLALPATTEKWEPLGPRLANRHDLTVRELFEALGESLSGIPTAMWDAPVYIGAISSHTVHRSVQDNEGSSPSLPETTATVVTFWYWSWITPAFEGDILYGSVTEASEWVMYMSVTSELIGPTSDSAHDSGLFTTRVEAWDLVGVSSGYYYSHGIHYYYDFTLDPSSDIWYSYSGTIFVP